MITRERIAELRRDRIPSRCTVTIAEDELIDLLDAAESAIELREQNERYKKSVAITDANFRVMQRERDSLREKAMNIVDALDDDDGRSLMHRDAGLEDHWKALRALVRE